MKHSSSEVKETEKGEEKSCVIYDTGPCSYMGSPLHVGSEVWPPYAESSGGGAALESNSPLLTVSLCSSLRALKEEK